MDIVKVAIENWPKTKPLILEWIPLFIAIFALLLSIYSAHLSRENFVLSYRPYLWALWLVNKPREVKEDVYLIRGLNAPSKYSVVTEYYGIKDTTETFLHRFSDQDTSVFFPSTSKDDVTHRTDFNVENEEFDRIRRHVRIDYSDLSSKYKYYFESDWIFSFKNGSLETVSMRNQKAN